MRETDDMSFAGERYALHVKDDISSAYAIGRRHVVCWWLSTRTPGRVKAHAGEWPARGVAYKHVQTRVGTWEVLMACGGVWDGHAGAWRRVKHVSEHEFVGFIR